MQMTNAYQNVLLMSVIFGLQHSRDKKEDFTSSERNYSFPTLFTSLEQRNNRAAYYWHGIASGKVILFPLMKSYTLFTLTGPLVLLTFI